MHFNTTKCYLLLLSVLAISFTSNARETEPGVAQASQMMQNKPLLFVENKGQIVDQNSNARKDIQFGLSANGISVLVGNSQLHYQFTKLDKDNNAESYRIDLSLLGANPDAKIITGQQLEYFERYLQPQFGANGVVCRSYQSVTYQNVYPGIDWVLYLKNNELEYDFIVHPGANAKNIQLAYGGATDLSLQADGSVIVKSPLGKVSEKAPLAYAQETGNKLAANFELSNNILSFNTEATKGTLVIDPVLKWATLYGGSGNVFATGTTTSTNQIATSGAFLGTYATNTDAFIVKFSPAGAIVWGTYFGGTGSDNAYGISIDGANNLYIVGNTTSTSGIASTGAAQTANAGPTGGGFSTGDAFLTKFDNNGNRIWGTYKGGCGNEQGFGVYVNSSYQVFITGSSATGIGGGCTGQSIASVTAYHTTTGGGTFYGDAFLAKYDTSGSLGWCTYYGGASDDIAYGVVSDAAGNNIYITGNTSSSPTGIATSGAYKGTYGGGGGFGTLGDAFVACFNGSGTALTWGTYFGGSSTDASNGIAIDGNGNVYIAGTTSSTSGIATPGAYHTTGGCTGNGCPTDGFIAKFSGTGTIGWATYYGGDSTDAINSVAVDQLNNVWVTGNTRTDTAMTTANGYQLTLGGTGSADAFIASFNGTGVVQYGSYLGGNSSDVGEAIGCSRSGKSVTAVAGYSLSASGIATSGAYQTTNAGPFSGNGATGDAFLAILSEDTVVTINAPFVDTVLCAGQAFVAHYTVNHNFAAGNTFTVQLSDGTGSFAAPVNIGSTNATASGNINVTIPALAAAGSAYRIRIVSTSPIDTSAIDGASIRIFKLIAPTLTSNSPLCVGDSIKFTATNNSSVNVNYGWTGPLAFATNVQNPGRANATTTMAGTYTCTVSYTGCTNQSSTIPVVVNSVIPAVPTASTNAPVCQGATLDLFSSSTTSGVTYQWTGPNAYTSTTQNPTVPNVSFNGGGNYYVVANLNGCRSIKDSVNVVISPSLTPSVTITANPANDSVCVGSVIAFTANVTNGGNNPSFQWFINNSTNPMVGAVSSFWSTPFLSNGDSVYCVLNIGNSAGCVTQSVVTSNLIGVTVLPVLTPLTQISVSPSNTVTLGTSVTFSNYIINGGTNPIYQWYVNGIAIPAPYGTGSVYTTQALQDGDVVTLTVMSSALCAQPDSANSQSITMHIGTSGVASINDPFENISLYPNPNNGTFTVKGILNGIKDNNVAFEILNTLGQVVYTSTLNAQNGQLNHMISANVADGIYMLRIKADDQSKVFRFVVQH